jgi:hypothetical protein
MNIYDHLKNTISTYFLEHGIQSHRLPQAYILYKSLQKLGHSPKLIMGHLLNHDMLVYHLHYWVELDGQTHDIVSETYVRQCQHQDGGQQGQQGQQLVRQLSFDIIDTYVNMYCMGFEQKQSAKYSACLNGRFLDDLKSTCVPIMYSKIKALYEKIC